MAPKTKRSRSGASTSSQAQPNLSGIFQNCFNDPNTEIDLFTQFQNFKTFPFETELNPNPQDDDGDDVAPPQAPPVVAAPPPVDIQALFAQLNANLDARFTAIDARFTTFTDDVNARFNSLDAQQNAMEMRFKAQEDALRRVETEVSAHHLEWSSHTFGGLGLNDHSDEEEEDTIPPPKIFLHAYHI
ncbi:hypothetical protein GQ457_13G025340 [Hibiscus cannabinus]